MQELNVISLIENYGIELAAGGLIACVVSILARNIFKLSAKTCLLIAFLTGAAVTFSIEFFAVKLEVKECLAKALTAGSVAVILTSFTKKLAFMDKNDVKSNIEKLLSSIVLSDELDKVVDEIVEKIKTDTTFTKSSLKDVLRENVDADIDENTLDLVASFILKSLDNEDKGE